MRSAWIGLLLLVATGCGRTLVVKVPDLPRLPFRSEPARAVPAAAVPRVECDFMTVVIDYSRNGEIEVAARVAQAMADEFRSLGTHVTGSSNEAYWSLMILASHNSRKDGYIFSAMLSARNMNEGYDPGVTLFHRNGEGGAARPDDPAAKPATLYNGLSYGPYRTLEDQARQFVHQAYAAIVPYAQRMCAFEEADEERERSLEEQIPGTPTPL